MNWINSWNAGNKKEKYKIDVRTEKRLGIEKVLSELHGSKIDVRIGTLTLLEIMFCPCDVCENKKSYCAKFRFMVFNLGFEI